jgi:hypothetical protein
MRHTHSGPDVEGMAGLLWDPVLVDSNKLGNEFGEGFRVECRESNTLGGVVHSLHIHVRAEECNTAVVIPVSLETLEQALGVVEDGCRWGNGERAICIKDISNVQRVSIAETYEAQSSAYPSP